MFHPCYLVKLVKSLSRVRLFATPWTVAHQAPLSMGFSRQEYWSGLPFPSPYLGPNYGGGNEDNGDLLQKIPCMYCYTQCPQPCSRPPLTHASARDSWTLMGKSGSVSCRVTAPFFWVLVHKVLFVPSKSLIPSPVQVLAALWWG